MHTHFFITAFLSSMFLGWLFRRTTNYHARFIIANMMTMIMAATMLMYIPGEFPIIRWGLIIAIFAAFIGVLWAFREGLRERQAFFILQRVLVRRNMKMQAMISTPVQKDSPTPDRSLN